VTTGIAAVVAMYGAFMVVGWVASRKVRDGTARAVAPATLEVLRHAGWIEAAELEQLRAEWRAPIVNFAGKHVGEIVARIV